MYYVHSLRLLTFCSFPVMRSFPFDHFRSTVKLFSMFEEKYGSPGQRIATSKFWIPIIMCLLRLLMTFIYLWYFSKRNHDEQYFIKQGLMIECDICNKLITKYSLRDHKKRHNSKLVKCSHCGTTVIDFSLKQHIEKKHKEERPIYSCEKCDKTYKDFDGLKFHLVVQHNDSRDSVDDVDLFTFFFSLLS